MWLENFRPFDMINKQGLEQQLHKVGTLRKTDVVAFLSYCPGFSTRNYGKRHKKSFVLVIVILGPPELDAGVLITRSGFLSLRSYYFILVIKTEFQSRHWNTNYRNQELL
jgi:hypothetical protein